jgi:DNA-binding NarL/FixJ family response regulator
MPFFTGRMSEQMLESYLATDPLRRESGLTPRERLVVQLIAEGHSNNEISKILNLSVKTVESHRATAMRKLHVTSTAAVIRYAVRNKLIEP